MNNNSMPRMKTSIILPFDLMDSAGDSWPLLVVILRIASEHPYGIIPPESINIGRVSRVFSAPSDEIARQALSLCEVGLISFVEYSFVARGNGWEREKSLVGWYCSRWPDVSSDRRRVDRTGLKVRSDAILFGSTGKTVDTRSELKMLEDKALSCMNVGGRRGRVLCLDAVSTKWLISLREKHGFQAVSDALEQSAGADRPVAMARKILSKRKGRGGSSVPSADEWRQG